MSLSSLGLTGIGRERMAWANYGSNNSWIKLSFQMWVILFININTIIGLSVYGFKLGVRVKLFSHGTQGLVHMLIKAPSLIR